MRFSYSIILFAFFSCESANEKRAECSNTYSNSKTYISECEFCNGINGSSSLVLNFSNETTIVSFDSIYGCLSYSKPKTVVLSIKKFKFPNQRTAIETIKNFQLLTDSLENNTDFTLLPNLESLDISIKLSAFPDALILPLNIRTLTINGNFERLPSFVYSLKNLEALILRADSLKEIDLQVAELEKLNLLDITNTSFGIELKRKNKIYEEKIEPFKSKNLILIYESPAD